MRGVRRDSLYSPPIVPAPSSPPSHATLPNTHAIPRIPSSPVSHHPPYRIIPRIPPSPIYPIFRLPVLSAGMAACAISSAQVM